MNAVFNVLYGGFICAEIMLRAANCYGGIFVVCRAEAALRVTDQLTVVLLVVFTFSDKHQSQVLSPLLKV